MTGVERGPIARNVAYARERYAEGGWALVARRGLAKAHLLTARHLRAGAREVSSRVRERNARAGGGPADEKGNARLLRAGFDASWYATFYGIHREPGEDSAFAHYLTVGAAAGFSPSAAFDEIAYRNAHPHVARAIARGEQPSGYHHHVVHGEHARHRTFAIPEAAHGSRAFPMHGELAEAVRADFAPDWYVAAYGDVAAMLRQGRIPSALWHYVTEGAAAGRSPNAWFDEHWYLRVYQDVANAKAAGTMPSGFVHFLRYGRAEGRRASPHAPTPGGVLIGELTMPVGIDRLRDIERKLMPFNFRVYPATGKRRVNFVIPTLDRNLLFAGYIAAMNFANRLLDRGWSLRLLITEDADCTSARLRKQFANDPLGTSLVNRAEVVNLARRTDELDITPDDSFIAYSMWSAHHADVFARAAGRRFVFFLQEYEPAFHSHDSLHALGEAMYRKPHFALFNSEFLRRYFAIEKLGVFAAGEQAGLCDSVVFEHTLAIPRPPRAAELRRAGPRRLLFYARPEAHASRNLFEIGVTALRAAVADNVLDGDWVFEGVGSLGTQTSVALGRGRSLSVSPRLALDDYARALRGFDIGLSMQYTPHPGVVHFEMAASGVVVVTNTFSNRSREDLLRVSGNLVPVPPTPECVAGGIAEAALRCADIESRVLGATGSWPTSWDQSFNEDVMAAVEAELA